MKKSIIFLATGLVVTLSVCFSHVVKTNAASNTKTYKVLNIVDGDTYDVTDTSGKNATRIRLACADAPETYQKYKNYPGYPNQLKWGTKATSRAYELINGKSISFTPNGGTNRDRTIGDVYLSNGQSLQVLLASEGLAALDYSYGNCNAAEEQAQAQAKKQRKNIWSDPNFKLPWLFRAKS